jgi:hypothetical protein
VTLFDHSIVSAVTNLARLHIRTRCDSVLRSIFVSLVWSLIAEDEHAASFPGYDTSFPKDRHTNVRVHREETRFDSHASRNAEDCHTFDRLVHTGRLILAVRHVRRC